MSEEKYKCCICKKYFDASETYEYRGAYACSEHFEEAQKKRDFERQEIIEEENHKLKPLEGLNFGDNVIGKANRQILKQQIDIAKKESGRMKDYEGRT